MLPQGATSNFDTTGQEMSQEREDIVKDLLIVLSSINQVNMEPNGDSFVSRGTADSEENKLTGVPDNENSVHREYFA